MDRIFQFLRSTEYHYCNCLIDDIKCLFPEHFLYFLNLAPIDFAMLDNFATKKECLDYLGVFFFKF